MPLPNRVTPLSDLIATPERGLIYGNRGCLHDAHGEIVRRQSTRRWIACRLRFRGRRRSARRLQPLHRGVLRASSRPARRQPDRRLHDAAYSELPDGAFVMYGRRPCLVRESWLLEWSPSGYWARHRRPANGRAAVITPPSFVALLGGGGTPGVPLLHPSALT